MDPSTEPSLSAQQADPGRNLAEAASGRLSALSVLLSQVDESGGPPLDLNRENELVQVRLGVASSLFLALQARHAPTAAHSLRVALGCSAWSLFLDLTDRQRDEIEVGALLHDIGKIGVPDQVLLKPGQLSSSELRRVQQHRDTGREVLRACCDRPEILDIVYYSAAWYNGDKEGFSICGEQLPLGARLVAIVDAFDAMTTDHVYRRAMSCERAVAELYAYAGAQFDPKLVEHFHKLLSDDAVRLGSQAAGRWLRQLDQTSTRAFWKLGQLQPAGSAPAIEELFYRQLFDNMLDGVVFIDASGKILLWNRGAERLTGVSNSSVLHRRWSPSLLAMRDEHSKLIPEDECPVARTIRSGVQTIRRLTISNRRRRRIALDVHIAPVVAQGGVVQGAAVLLHDASPEISLEERVETLHEQAIQDPLTGLANRAEFDRTLADFVRTHLQQRIPCSLIICDIDFFKRVNDDHGHQAGDEALTSFASLLKRSCRHGDLVARYGGEEFVMLCADCGNATATERAESIRRQLAEIPQPALGGRPITASFGVTEIQAGDTPETMLRRADRALLDAKRSGRNTVVQLGAGLSGENSPPQLSGWFAWLRSDPPGQAIQRAFVSPTPLNVAAEKLRGFVADHHAEVVHAQENRVLLKLDAAGPLRQRRSDRPVPCLLELTFQEEQTPAQGRIRSPLRRTIIRAVIRPQRNRDRRRGAAHFAKQLLLSLKSYFMAQDLREPDRDRGDPPQPDAAPEPRDDPTPQTPRS